MTSVWKIAGGVFIGVVAAAFAIAVVIDIKRTADKDAELRESVKRLNEDVERRAAVDHALFGPKPTPSPWTREDEIKRRNEIARRAGLEPQN